MAEEVKYRVNLDTRSAKQKLSDFVKKGKKVAKRVRGIYGRTVGAGLSAIGLGGGIGVGLAAVRGATQSGFGDAIGEALGPFSAQLENLFLGEGGAEARAARRAREDAIAAGKWQAGAEGREPEWIRGFTESRRRLYEVEEKGAQIIRQDASLYGPGLDKVIGQIMKGLGTIAREVADYFLKQLGF